MPDVEEHNRSLRKEIVQATRKGTTLEARVKTLENDLTQMRKLFVREGHRQQRRFDRILLRCTDRMLRWFMSSWAILTCRSVHLNRALVSFEAAQYRKMSLKIFRLISCCPIFMSVPCDCLVEEGTFRWLVSDVPFNLVEGVGGKHRNSLSEPGRVSLGEILDCIKKIPAAYGRNRCHSLENLFVYKLIDQHRKCKYVRSG